MSYLLIISNQHMAGYHKAVRGVSLKCASKKFDMPVQPVLSDYTGSRERTPLSSSKGTKLVIRAGFVMKESMPAPILSRCKSLCAAPVNAIILAGRLKPNFCSNPRICLDASMPSMIGMEMSSNRLDQVKKDDRKSGLKLTHDDQSDRGCVFFEKLKSF